MTTGPIAKLAMLAALSACAAPFSNPEPEPTEPTLPVPEQVAALAAPGQDLMTARLLPEDNCFWYLHSGPVETTLLPLRAANGRPICMAPPAKATEAADA